MGKFRFHTNSIYAGWYDFELTLNDKIIRFDAGYCASNPLNELIQCCLEYLLETDRSDYHICLDSEPVELRIRIDFETANLLKFIVEKVDEGEILEKWEETVDFNDFVNSVISEGFRVLNAFGLYGYRKAWATELEFPLGALLKIYEIHHTANEEANPLHYKNELEILNTQCKDRANEEAHLDRCTVYYAAWQLQCCGDPFKVGDRITWTCALSSSVEHGDGTIVDFHEEHHGDETHSITGTVAKIFAERSESSRAKSLRGKVSYISYNYSEIIKDELQEADGWESEYESDETTVRTLWGYLVTLEDVTVRPLNLNTKSSEQIQ